MGGSLSLMEGREKKRKEKKMGEQSVLYFYRVHSPSSPLKFSPACIFNSYRWQ